jgi:hypothetical protein
MARGMLRILCHRNSTVKGEEIEIRIPLTGNLITDEPPCNLAESDAIASKSQSKKCMGPRRDGTNIRKAVFCAREGTGPLEVDFEFQPRK